MRMPRGWVLSFIVACGGGGGGTDGASTSGTGETGETGTTAPPATTTTMTSTDPPTTNPSTDPDTTDPSTDPATTDPSTDPATSDPSTDPDTTDATTSLDTGETTATTGGTTGGDGELVCKFVMDCVFTCNPPSQQCAGECIAMGTPNGAAEAQDVVDCFIGCNLDQACIEMECAEEQYACFHGPLTCPELVDCATACGQDEMCVQSCYYEGLEADQTAFEDVGLCQMMNQCPAPDSPCTEMACPDDYSSCFG